MTQCRTAIDHNVPIQIVQALLDVALNEGLSMTELADKMGANNSTMSRHLLDLGERNRKMGPGYMLVDRKVDPMCLRTNSYTLTPKGRLLAKTLNELLEDRA